MWGDSFLFNATSLGKTSWRRCSKCSKDGKVESTRRHVSLQCYYSFVLTSSLRRLKVISSSGDRLYDDTVKGLTDHLNRFRKDRNINLFDVWWQTETVRVTPLSTFQTDNGALFKGAFMMGSSSKIIGVNEHPKRVCCAFLIDY